VSVTADAAAATLDDAVVKARRRARRRRIAVNVARVLTAVLVLGSWQLFSHTWRIVDPFFFGQPSGIWSQLVTWVQKGTAQGPLWEQIATTLEEVWWAAFRAPRWARQIPI